MKKISYNILKENLAGTCLFPKYPSGDLSESHLKFPFVDSSISEEQFKKESLRFESFNSFWEVLDYSNLEDLKFKDSVFVMHPFNSQIMSPNQLAIPLETLVFLNHKGNVNHLAKDSNLSQHLGLIVGNGLSLSDYLSMFELSNLSNFVIKVPYSAAGDGVCVIKDYSKGSKETLKINNQLIY